MSDARARLCAREGCSNPLPEDAHPNRKHCSDRCRELAKHQAKLARNAATCRVCGIPVSLGSKFCGEHRPGRPAEAQSSPTVVGRRLSSLIAQRGLSQDEAAKRIGILPTGLSKLLHQPSPGMHRETAAKLARWDGGWSAATYRARRADLYETLRTRGKALGQASKGKPKPVDQVKKMRAGLARTMASKHRGEWQRSHMKKMRTKGTEAAERRAREGIRLKRRSPEVGQKIAVALRAKGRLYFKATGGLRSLAAKPEGASLDDYLILEYVVRGSADAVNVVRKAIKRRKGKRPRDYTLVQVLDRLAQGDSTKQIAERWVLEKRRAQQVIGLARSVDNRAV